MNTLLATEQNKLSVMSERASDLVHDANEALERMDTALTLAEAKVALVRHLIVKRHLREVGHKA
jgi:hypothetical protein